MKKRQFIVQVKLDNGREIALIEQVYNGKIEKTEQLVRIDGFPLHVIEEELIRILRGEGYKISSLQNKGFVLNEDQGVRVALLFQLIKPLKKLDRIEKIKMGLNKMENEEIYYWYSLSNRDGKKQNIKRAMRIILSGE